MKETREQHRDRELMIFAPKKYAAKQKLASLSKKEIADLEAAFEKEFKVKAADKPNLFLAWYAEKQ